MTTSRGFSLVEVMVATMVLGGLFVAAMSAVTAAQAGRIVEEQRTTGRLLAEELMSEVLDRAYREANTTTLGLDSGDNDYGTRRDGYDDVDDYHGLNETTLRRRDGEAIGGPGYTRTVEVRWAELANPAVDAASDTGLKRITVVVHWQGRLVSRLVALRSSARPEAHTVVEFPE